MQFKSLNMYMSLLFLLVSSVSIQSMDDQPRKNIAKHVTEQTRVDASDDEIALLAMHLAALHVLHDMEESRSTIDPKNRSHSRQRAQELSFSGFRRGFLNPKNK